MKQNSYIFKKNRKVLKTHEKSKFHNTLEPLNKNCSKREVMDYKNEANDLYTY